MRSFSLAFLSLSLLSPSLSTTLIFLHSPLHHSTSQLSALLSARPNYVAKFHGCHSINFTNSMFWIKYKLIMMVMISQ
jgi:hypothetical protein